MRKIDKNKTIFQRVAQTITFEVIILKRLQELAIREKTTVSNIVNSIVRQAMINDRGYYSMKAKYYASLMNEALDKVKLFENESEMRYMREPIQTKIPG